MNLKNLNNLLLTSKCSLISDENSNIALKLLSIFDYITYEVAGGEEPEIFIRLNDPNKIDNRIALAKQAFPDYEIINPLSDVNNSVDTVCFYITIVLIIFSLVATVISVLLLTICNYLYIIEGRKEIALARCIGVNKKESKKFLFWHSFMQCLISFIVASIELLAISLVANFEVANSLSLGFAFSFDPIALLPMLVLSLVIALFSSVFMSRKINKINPIEALKA